MSTEIPVNDHLPDSPPKAATLITMPAAAAILPVNTSTSQHRKGAVAAQVRRTYSTSRYGQQKPSLTLARKQPFSLRAAALFIGTGAVMILYFQYEKQRLERKRVVEMSKGYGRPKVGGPFQLRDVDGKEYSEKDLLGKYTLVSQSPSTYNLDRNSPIESKRKDQRR
jgi:cytochrome oxidase Cu insertion factor (SCO1/SenC/PrrC family)